MTPQESLIVEPELDLSSADVRGRKPKLHVYPKEKKEFLMGQLLLAVMAFREYDHNMIEYKNTKDRSMKNLISSRWNNLKYWERPPARKIVEKARKVSNYSENTSDAHIFEYFAKAYCSLFKKNHE